MHCILRSILLLGAVAPLLAACGGGGTGGVASAPAPVVSPAPTPSASPTSPPVSVQPVKGTVFETPLHNAQLAVVGKGWQHEYGSNPAAAQDVRVSGDFAVTYDQVSDTYRVTGPVIGSGELFRVGPLEGDSYAARIAENVTAAAGKTGGLRVYPADQASSRYRYASLMWFVADTTVGSNLHTTAYGAIGVAQPTRAGEVPITGTASYVGDLFGVFGGDVFNTWLEGTSRFDFDFAKALLSGSVTVSMRCGMGCSYPSSTYNLTNTQFVQGGTTFSGGLASTGSFAGLFAGPGAAEMLAQFQLPYFSPAAKEWVTASGVILGRRD